jgi:hypothetical protein
VIKGNHKSKEQIVRARIHPVASVFACVAMVLAFVASFAGTAFASGASSVKNQSATVQLGYTPLSAPVRVCDTRPTSQTGGVSDVTTASGVSSQCDNSGNALMAGSELDVTFPTTVVPSGAQAVVLNVTAISPSATGYLTAYPATGAAPTQITSNLNVKMGQTVANEVTVQTSSSGVDVYYGPSTNSGASVNIAVDVEGYYMTPTSSSGDPYTAISPVRIADTRCGVSSPPSFCSSENLPSANSSLATVGPGGKIHVQVAGVDSIPSSATAAVLNVTTTDTSSSSFLSVYPTSSAPSPLTSNQNWVAGETIASQVIVGIGTNGDVTLYNDSGNADFVVDVDGYFTAPGTSGSLFTPVSPSRLADTRCGVSPAPSFCSSENLPSANATLSAPSGGQSITVATGAPSNATAVAVNVTDVQPTNGNFLTVYPTGQTSIPVVSTLNWVPGDTYNVVPNFAYATLGTSGDISVYNGPSTTGPANVLVDYYGYFSKPVVTSALTLTASSTSVPAEAGTVDITATVTENGALIRGDTVDFTASSSACGTLSSATGTTDGDGQVVVTYTPSDTQGTCTIDAQEADYAMTASTSITQTAPVNSITVAYSSSNGSVTATVTNAYGDVSGDTVDFSVSGYPSETCGTLSANSATTNSSGEATVSYAPTTAPGFCTITGTETETNQSGTAEAIVDTSGTTPVSVSPSSTSVGPGGTATLTISGSPDTPVMLSTAPASDTPTACGTVDQFVTTDDNGIATVTYTGSNAIGSCAVTATEAADSDSSSSATVKQTNDLAVVVLPTSLPANGTDTATVTYTITGPGGVPVMGGTVKPISPAVFANNTTTDCGTISSVSGTTGSTGQATATYTEDTTTSGLCYIAGSDHSGASGSTELVLTSTTAMNTPYVVTVTASPASIPADVQSSSTVTVVVSNSVGDPVSGDVVGLSTSGSACGTLSSDTAKTNSAGQALVTYSATTTTGTCTISALESEDGQVGSGSITQTAGVNTLTFSSTTVSTTAGGTGSVTVTVDNPQDQPVEDDTLTATVSPLYPTTNAVCGTVSVSGPTSSTGQATITYTEPSNGTTGFCSVDVTDDTGQSGSFVVDQTSPTNSDTYTNTVAASPTSVDAGGTVTITATVENSTTTSPVANDPVMFVLTPASGYSSLSCGSLSTEFATTNSSGVATVTYTAPSNQGGECSVRATEAVDSQSGSADVTSGILNSLSLTANPTAVAAGGTSQITATVTSPNGKPVQGDLVDFTAPSTSGCGTLSAESAYTGANGEATVTYTAGSSTGLFCTIGATETDTGQTASVTVDQQN